MSTLYPQMDSRHIFTPELVCNSGFAIGEDRTAVSTRNQTSLRVLPSSFFIRTVMKISRSQCYCFLRRLFHYQNGLRSELGSNPLNSVVWMVTELIVLVVQITMITYTLANSKKERPLWPMRIWVTGYSFGCVLSLLQLCWRYLVFVVPQGDASNLPDIEQQRSLGESRYIEIMNKCRGLLELFFAIWFIIGNVWMFDSRFGSVHQAPKLRILCISLLSWNAISYSIPFYLFVLLCCIVPLLSTLIGYNMNMGSVDRGALDEQLSKLPSWSHKEVGGDVQDGNSNQDCCICLAKYREKEEIRQLPCSHVFHLKCVDQWLRIICCCPLCKQQLHR